jgi:hypothetical protein
MLTYVPKAKFRLRAFGQSERSPQQGAFLFEKNHLVGKRAGVKDEQDLFYLVCVGICSYNNSA